VLTWPDPRSEPFIMGADLRLSPGATRAGNDQGRIKSPRASAWMELTLFIGTEGAPECVSRRSSIG
jgi:hypothetical protein